MSTVWNGQQQVDTREWLDSGLAKQIVDYLKEALWNKPGSMSDFNQTGF